jgi:hypothetical protein
MNIYLAYITNKDGIRINQLKFTTVCVKRDFNMIRIMHWMRKKGWKLDAEFGISITEAVAMAKARHDYESEHHATQVLGG